MSKVGYLLVMNHIIITAVSEVGQPMMGCRNHKGDVTAVREV